MPALPPTPSGVLRFTMHVEQPNGDHVGSKHDMRYTGSAPSTADLAALAGFGVTAFATHLAAFLSESAVLEDYTCVDLANPGTPEGTAAVSAVGDRTGSPVPNNIAACMVDQIDRRYRGSRPKRFLPFFTDTDMSGTISWLPASVTALNTAWGAYIAELEADSAGGTSIGAPVGVSYFSGKHPNPNPNGRQMFLPTPRAVPALFDVLSSAVDQRFGSQRRRLTAS